MEDVSAQSINLKQTHTSSSAYWLSWHGIYNVYKFMPYMCYDPEQYVPTMRLDTGVFSATTCIHPPGAAQRSMTTRAWFKKLNFLFS